MLEELEHAKARGARIYGEIVGYGATSDGFDMVAPSGEGAVRCMRQALATYKGPIDYINPHGTSTPVGDGKEIEAIKEVFGGADRSPRISATKSLTGHSLGATGVQEAIYSLLMLNNDFICQSAHIEELDPAFADMPIVRERIDNARLGAVLSNSFGFGGTNATIVMKRLEAVTPMGLMEGKRGLVMGVANQNSIAWGIASMLEKHGAECAFTYQGEALGKRVKPLAESIGSRLVLPCDVEDIASVDAVFDTLKAEWGKLDFLVHAIGFSNKDELKGLYADTSRENFTRTMVISCFSFTEAAKRAAALMGEGGSMVTLTYGGSMRLMPNYNVMGVAKAALEASVRYLASDFGPRGIRVNALSPGPVRTLAGAGISDARAMFAWHGRTPRCGKSVSLDEIGGSALYFLSELSGGVTGEVHHIDAGYHITSMPVLEVLKDVRLKGDE